MKLPSGRQVLIAIAGLFLAIQIVPYGCSHDNPPVTAKPEWDSPRTEELARRACFDCHSNETRWPWYSYVAPVSWWLHGHVSDGRRHLNFSNWDRPQKHAHEAAAEVRDGDMPLPSYLRGHPEARLSEAEKAELVRGLVATFGDEDDEKKKPEGEKKKP